MRLACCICDSEEPPRFLHNGRIFCLDHLPLDEFSLWQRTQIILQRVRRDRQRRLKNP